MRKFNAIKTGMNDLYLVETPRFEDERGCFIKNFESSLLAEIGIKFSICEAFYTISKKHVLRGLHFQTRKPQTKLVTVTKGYIYDVVVDLRKNSQTFGRWEGFYLGESDSRSLLIPRGFAHGFLSLTDDSIVDYKCDGHYDGLSDSGIIYNDQTLDIKWPVSEASTLLLSNRDRSFQSFKEFSTKEIFE